jgi:hypothetical protein
VVVAGFGSDQPFPAISAFEAEGTARGYLKYKVSGNEEVSNASIAIVAPFAQSEMVHAFMSGVTPDYTLIVESSIERVVKELPGVVLEEVPSLSPVEVGDIAARIASKAPAIVSEYLSKLAAYSKDNYIDPVVSAVASLPKDELAAMAESLVNLTSFKRRVSMAPETVGGPIDVAVISKGDGMVWIKRKHYFDPELNQAYLSRRFRRAT